jgi:LysM domain-containing protein
MRTTLKVAGWTLATLVAGSQLVFAADAQAAKSTRPPKDLKQVGDHWTPWDPPQPTAESYVIQRGDTLWDLANKWLGDPHLWPQVWDQNRYILDSHWIYPGDPLAVPGKPNVVPPEGPAPTAAAQPPAGEQGEQTAAVGETAPEAPEPHPSAPATPAMIQLADEHDLYCSGWVDSNHEPSTLVVEGSELEKIMQAGGDIVFLNQGRNQGIAAGAEYLVVRPDHKVVHPATNEALGTYMQRMGHVRVLCAQENTATAVILGSCEGVRAGDELLPWKELPSPKLERIPTVDRCMEPSGLAQGWVVDGGADELHSVGGGNVIATDLGDAAGVRPGSLLTIFRDNGDLPRLILGQAVVLTVDGATSTVKILHSSREVKCGDRAEVLQQ